MLPLKRLAFVCDFLPMVTDSLASAWRRYPALCVLGMFVLLAVVHTWPLASDPAGLSRNENSDTVLNEWALAWVAHQTFAHPLQLFEANIFYPSHLTLAFSEHMFPVAMMGAPLFWLGASPVLVYNLLLLAGFALSGWSLAIVMHRWTGDWLAGILAGCIFAFNTHTLTRLPHLQALHLEFLPPALFALDTLLRDPRIRHGLMLALWFVLAALTSNYLLVFTLTALGAALIVRPDACRLPPRLHQWHLLQALGIAAIVSAVVLFPFLWPYHVVQQLYGFVRSLQDVTMYSATWNDYVATAGRLHYALWSEPFYHRANVALFPGVVPLGLAAAAIATGVALRDRRARMCLAVGVAGLLLSFGTSLPGYALLYRVIPLLQGIRSVNRFGFLLIFAIAALAGFTIASLRTHARTGTRLATMIAIVAIVLVNAEAWRAPMQYQRFDNIPGIYTLLAHEPNAIVAEFPFDDPHHAYEGAISMLYSTRHWRPMLNGYSGFIPPSYRDFAEKLADFPSAHALDTLRAAGVTHIVVHHDRFGPMPEQVDGLSLIATGRHISLYRLQVGSTWIRVTATRSSAARAGRAPR